MRRGSGRASPSGSPTSRPGHRAGSCAARASPTCSSGACRSWRAESARETCRDAWSEYLLADAARPCTPGSRSGETPSICSSSGRERTEDGPDYSVTHASAIEQRVVSFGHPGVREHAPAERAPYPCLLLGPAPQPLNPVHSFLPLLPLSFALILAAL